MAAAPQQPTELVDDHLLASSPSPSSEEVSSSFPVFGSMAPTHTTTTAPTATTMLLTRRNRSGRTRLFP